MMGDRRVIIVLRAEKMLKPKRRGKGDEDGGRGRRDAERRRARRARGVRAQPEPQTTLVFVAADVDRTRALYKTLQKQRDDRRVLGTEGRQGRARRSAAGGADRRSSWSGRPSRTPGSRSIPRPRG